MNGKNVKLRKSNSQFYTVPVRTFVIPFYYGSGLSTSDPHHFAPDADSTFTLMRIRIRLLSKVVRICSHWPTGPPQLQSESPRFYCKPSWLYCEPPWLNCEPPQLLAVDCDADPDPAFDFKVDPASQK